MGLWPSDPWLSRESSCQGEEWSLRGFGIALGIFLPGNGIPDWFTYKDEGPSLYFKVPHIIDGNIQWFTVCIVYSACPDRILGLGFPTNSISIVNYTKGRTETMSPITTNAVNTDDDGDHMWQANFSKHWFHSEAGDEVEVIVDFGLGFDVKKIGVCPVYDMVNDGKMIHYASTSNKGVIVVSDDEDESTDQVAIESKRSLGVGDDKAESSHGCLDNEREAKRLRCEQTPDDKAESSHGCFDDDQEPKRLRCDHNSEMSIDDV
ncbi:hypothetical protein FH972_024768 [Carpinus fangiana]|uniref:C-JID domain-containing protein n=1 Tax=Carpinus fangiana TaxID=176857 RepID=A0A5N6KZ00_9ROSI|nr:hypothetical protein FH972_024768 [Carpinus fangiana]